MRTIWLGVLVMACGGAAKHEGTTPPPAVQATAKRLAGDAKIERVEQERGGTYEVTWHIGGLEREATIDASGGVIEVEEEIESTQVPAPVRAAAIARLANAQQMKFVKLQSGNYEVEAMIDGQEHEAVFAADGREIGGDGDRDDDD